MGVVHSQILAECPRQPFLLRLRVGICILELGALRKDKEEDPAEWPSCERVEPVLGGDARAPSYKYSWFLKFMPLFCLFGFST